MPTLVLPLHSSPDTQRLSKAALAMGWGVEHLSLDGAINESIAEPVIYGDAPIDLHAVAQKLGLTLIEPPTDWLLHVPEMFLRRDVLFTTLGDAYDLRYPTFVKSAHKRLFGARVYTSGKDLRSEAGRYPESTPVYVSDVVRFTHEYRCFVLNRKIVTAARYTPMPPAWEQDPILNEAVLFAHEVVYRMDGDCPPAFVLDVGLIEDRGWAVVEANPCWGAGLGGCNEAEVLRVLRRASVGRSTS